LQGLGDRGLTVERSVLECVEKERHNVLLSIDRVSEPYFIGDAAYRATNL